MSYICPVTEIKSVKIYKNFITFYLFICVRACTHVLACTGQRKSQLSCYHAGPGNYTQGARPGSKMLYSLSLLTGPPMIVIPN